MNKTKRTSVGKLCAIFPDGEIFCYSSSKQTFIQVLRHIGSEKLSNLNFDFLHKSTTSNPTDNGHKECMEKIDDSLFVNIQGDTLTKYRQLRDTSKQLNLGIELKLVKSPSDVIIQHSEIDVNKIHTGKTSRKRPQYTLIGTNKDGEITQFDQDNDFVFNLLIELKGNLLIDREDVLFNGKMFVTSQKKYKNQKQLGQYWYTIPSSLKAKVKILNIISIILKLNFRFSYKINDSATCPSQNI